MALVTEKLKTTLDAALAKVATFERSVVKLEKRAKAQVEETRTLLLHAKDDVPAQLKGAALAATDKVRGALVFATKEDLADLAARVDALADRIDALAKKPRKSAARA